MAAVTSSSASESEAVSKAKAGVSMSTYVCTVYAMGQFLR